MSADPIKLTMREYEVLALISAGRSTREIALDLRITHNTAKGYRKALNRKCGRPIPRGKRFEGIAFTT